MKLYKILGVMIGMMCIITPVFANETDTCYTNQTSVWNSDKCPISQTQYKQTCVINNNEGPYCEACANAKQSASTGGKVCVTEDGTLNQTQLAAFKYTQHGYTVEINGANELLILKTPDGREAYYVKNNELGYSNNLDQYIIINGIANANVDNWTGQGGEGANTFFRYIAKTVYYVLFGLGVLFGVIKEISAVVQFFSADNPQAKAQYKSDMKEPLIGLALFSVIMIVVQLLYRAFFDGNFL